MSEHDWQPHSFGSLPPNAIVAGNDSDGDDIYIGRVIYNKDLLPAKVIPNKGKAYVCYGGQEIEVDHYEVLNGPHYDWLPGANGEVPPSAVSVGYTTDGERLYAGRGYHAGSLTVGKVHPSHGCLYIPYDADEVQIFEYEVLSHPERWVDVKADSMPMDALIAGYDDDGDTIYVGRVMHDGDMLPAKVVPAKKKAYAAYAQEECEFANVQVLVGAGYLWTQSSYGNIVPGAVTTGSTVDGESLYVGRAQYGESLTVGKIHPSHGCIYIPFGGEEIRMENYEVLVRC